MNIPRWYALVYQTTTGQVVNEIPLTADPAWARTLNQRGSWQIATQVGGTFLSKTALRALSTPGKWSVAVCWGTGTPNDSIMQAGPIWTWDHDDTSNTLTIAGGGIWSMFDLHLMVPPTWNFGYGFGDARSDVSYGPDTLTDIAIKMVSDSIVDPRTLPIDLPPQVGTGTKVRQYHGYDMAYVGQRLMELTQSDGGPDIDFAPYFGDANHVRHNMVVGAPLITQSGDPIVFDYPSSVTKIKTSGDGTKLATIAYVKGPGFQYQTTSAVALDASLYYLGWPLAEYVDSSHSSVADGPTIQDWANADLARYRLPIETWRATVRADLSPYLGSYVPGYQARFNMMGHAWIPDGSYLQRITSIGQSQQSKVNEIDIELDATMGVV